jgi:hypothetical protein
VNDEKAFGMIAKTLSMELNEIAFTCGTAAELWSKLTKLYANPSIQNLGKWRGELARMVISEDDNIAAKIEEFDALRRKLAGSKVEVGEEEAIVALMNLLPKSWDSFCSGIGAREKQPTYMELKQIINDQAEGPRRNEEKKRDLKVFNANGFKGKCNKCGKVGHMMKECRSKEAKKCDNCGKPGHIREDCYSSGGGKEGGGPKQNVGCLHQ